MLLADRAQPNLTSIVASPFVADLTFITHVVTDIAVTTIGTATSISRVRPRLTNAYSEAETIPVWRNVGNLTNPVSVHITRTNTAQSGRTTATSANTNAQQSHVRQDSVRTEDAQITTSLDSTPALVTESQVSLTNVQAVVTTSCATITRINTGEECELECDIQIVLTSLTTDTQSGRQQTGLHGVSYVFGTCSLQVARELGVSVVSVNVTTDVDCPITSRDGDCSVSSRCAKCHYSTSYCQAQFLVHINLLMRFILTFVHFLHVHRKSSRTPLARR
ncbi:hypothetical protein MPQ_2445 [Methylovorus sp. MP688]|nr:hypothetical protein MPQ_2445 [Methylovorus sp. MP688]